MAKMTKKQYVKEVTEKKDEYLKLVSDYVDAMINCDWSKVNEIGTNVLGFFSPEVCAFMAEGMEDCENYDILEDTYIKYAEDVQDNIGTEEEIKKKQNDRKSERAAKIITKLIKRIKGF